MKSFVKMFVVLAVLLLTANVRAQMPQQLSDPAVRVGKLPNGLTYYIRHNEYPKGQADFHIAQKVGAVQENEDQNGLAHFLEHMCFNGTKNFPDKLILTWLESKGVKFGMNLNAHTGTDETVYDIMNVPVQKKEVVDSCLLILHDWADALTLADEEIEKERGVIHEEWRMGNGAVSRILNRHAAELYPGTKYATHDVIGSMDIIDNFKPQVLRDYYEKWYRPDLQGIIVVGDVDVDAVEAKIKELFSPIKMPENPAKFEYQVLGDNEEPIVISDKDKEMPANVLFVAQKYDFLPREFRNTDIGILMEYIDFIINQVLNERLTAIQLSPDAPFSTCDAAMSNFLYANTKGALLFQAVVGDKGSEAALRAVLTELKRMQKFGFTAGEYERARNEYVSALEKQYNNFKTSKNDYFTQIYINNFIESNPITAVDYEYNTMKDQFAMLPVDQINAYIKEQFVPGKNLVVMSLCPDKEGVAVPTVEQLKQVIAEVDSAEVEAYADNQVTEPLMEKTPKAGKIKKETKNDALGYTQLTLSNGAKVVLKKTTFKEDEIRLYAVSKGGASVYDANDYSNAVFSCDMIGSTGLGKFSYTDLQKILSGKQASVSMDVSAYDESVSGRSSVKDLETMMQLMYLSFTQPREDKAAFENIKKMMISQVENASHSPQYVFQDSLVTNLYGHHPKAVIQSKEAFEKVDYDRAIQIYKERFANAADFTFFIVGNFDENQIRQYVKQYIASLPANKNFEKAVNDGREIVAGNVRKQFVNNNEGKLAMLAMVWNMDMPLTMKNKLIVSITGQLMSNELLNSVREDEGAAYSPYSVGYIDRTYKDNATIQTSFGLNPDKYKTSETATIKCLEKLSKDIPVAELKKMQEYMLKSYDENIVENGYWLGVLESYVVDGEDMYTGYKKAVEELTVGDIENFVDKLIKSENRFEILMLPE